MTADALVLCLQVISRQGIESMINGSLPSMGKDFHYPSHLHREMIKHFMQKNKFLFPTQKFRTITHCPLGPWGHGSNFKCAAFLLYIQKNSLATGCECPFRWIPQNLNDDKSTLVQVVAWCHQATSHYLEPVLILICVNISYHKTTVSSIATWLHAVNQQFGKKKRNSYVAWTSSIKNNYLQKYDTSSQGFSRHDKDRAMLELTFNMADLFLRLLKIYSHFVSYLAFCSTEENQMPNEANTHIVAYPILSILIHADALATYGARVPAGTVLTK